MDHKDVVEIVNRLGYITPFAAVAPALTPPVTPSSLYALYTSMEDLGRQWVESVIPDTATATAPTIGSLYRLLCSSVVLELETYRDFGRAWVSAATVMGPGDLPTIVGLEAQFIEYFRASLQAVELQLSFPKNVALNDIVEPLAGALSALGTGVLIHWAADRSTQAADTTQLIDSSSYLLDAALTRRAEFGNAGLLTHAWHLVDIPKRRFARPLLDRLLPKELTSRFADPVSLVEFLRSGIADPASRQGEVNA